MRLLNIRKVQKQVEQMSTLLKLHVTAQEKYLKVVATNETAYQKFCRERMPLEANKKKKQEVPKKLPQPETLNPKWAKMYKLLPLRCDNLASQALT